jgi:hypothetical protein
VFPIDILINEIVTPFFRNLIVEDEVVTMEEDDTTRL